MIEEEGPEGHAGWMPGGGKWEVEVRPVHGFDTWTGTK